MSGNSPINTLDPYHSEEEPSSGPPCMEDIGIILFKKLIRDCGGSLGQEMATTFVQELQQAMGQEDLHNEMKERDANTPPDLREMEVHMHEMYTKLLRQELDAFTALLLPIAPTNHQESEATTTLFRSIAMIIATQRIKSANLKPAKIH
ncbi:hypothetical protein B0H17DRAFT_1145901 [Mycena rosella]|uniref:Uncharacterized protein n=1 Tax=Mycena rosella TaxID=1033263 RepID=A0AAD7G1W1_MYCRO|nr:hypothetical protein B0H17DRAFT_1145901 [Mycena rosella]